MPYLCPEMRLKIAALMTGTVRTSLNHDHFLNIFIKLCAGDKDKVAHNIARLRALDAALYCFDRRTPFVLAYNDLSRLTPYADAQIAELSRYFTEADIHRKYMAANLMHKIDRAIPRTLWWWGGWGVLWIDVPLNNNLYYLRVIVTPGDTRAERQRTTAALLPYNLKDYARVPRWTTAGLKPASNRSLSAYTWASNRRGGPRVDGAALESRVADGTAVLVDLEVFLYSLEHEEPLLDTGGVELKLPTNISVSVVTHEENQADIVKRVKALLEIAVDKFSKAVAAAEAARAALEAAEADWAAEAL